MRVWGAAGSGWHTPVWLGIVRFARSSYVNRSLFGISTSAVSLLAVHALRTLSCASGKQPAAATRHRRGLGSWLKAGPAPSQRRKPEEHPVRYDKRCFQHSAWAPRGERCPCPTLACAVHPWGPRRASLWPMQPKRTHAFPRRTLSVTIASQTIASSPDGSETSSAAKFACGPPAATVGCRFRASSTVTSSSSPCNDT